MPPATSPQQLESTSLEATIIRADGTRVELGPVAYWHRRRWRRVLAWLRHPRLRGPAAQMFHRGEAL